MTSKLHDYLRRVTEAEISADPFANLALASLPPADAQSLKRVRQLLLEGRESLADVETAARVMSNYGMGGEAEDWVFTFIEGADDAFHMLYRRLFGDMCVSAFERAKKDLTDQLGLIAIRPPAVDGFLSETGEYELAAPNGGPLAEAGPGLLHVRLRYDGNETVAADVTSSGGTGTTSPWVYLDGKWLSIWDELAKR